MDVHVVTNSFNIQAQFIHIHRDMAVHRLRFNSYFKHLDFI